MMIVMKDSFVQLHRHSLVHSFNPCWLLLHHHFFNYLLRRELVEMQERYKLQSKELKDAVSQRKMAMGEFAEVNDRLSEMRTAKQGLSRQVRTAGRRRMRS